MVLFNIFKGADPSKKDEQGFTPSNYTADQNILELLKSYKSKEEKDFEDRKNGQEVEVEDKINEDQEQKEEPEETSNIMVEQEKQIYCESDEVTQLKVEEVNKKDEFGEEGIVIQNKENEEEKGDAEEEGTVEQNQEIGVEVETLEHQTVESTKSEQAGNQESDKETKPVINESSDEGKTELMQVQKPEVTEVEGNQMQEPEEMQKTSDSETEDFKVKQEDKNVSENDGELKVELMEEQKLKTNESEQVELKVFTQVINELDYAEPMEEIFDEENQKVIESKESKELVQCDQICGDNAQDLKGWGKSEFEEGDLVIEQVGDEKAWYEKPSVRYIGSMLILVGLCALGIKPF